MHSDGFDLLTVSMARAGALPLLIERAIEQERTRRLQENGDWPSEQAIRELERQARQASRRKRLAGRLLRGGGQLLAAVGAWRVRHGKLARAGVGAAATATAPRLQGCG